MKNLSSKGSDLLGNQQSRPKHKEQWDRRLLSYVRKKQEESADADEHEGPSEHNLAVEVVSRAAVCAYEKARGRVAEQMAQTHPGYDIISRNPLTGEDRFIEVKGVNGEWNQTGVGLSRLQFSNAQDYGENVDRKYVAAALLYVSGQRTEEHDDRSGQPCHSEKCYEKSGQSGRRPYPINRRRKK